MKTLTVYSCIAILVFNMMLASDLAAEEPEQTKDIDIWALIQHAGLMPKDWRIGMDPESIEFDVKSERGTPFGLKELKHHGDRVVAMATEHQGKVASLNTMIRLEKALDIQQATAGETKVLYRQAMQDGDGLDDIRQVDLLELLIFNLSFRNDVKRIVFEYRSRGLDVVFFLPAYFYQDGQHMVCVVYTPTDQNTFFEYHKPSVRVYRWIVGNARPKYFIDYEQGHADLFQDFSAQP